MATPRILELSATIDKSVQTIHDHLLEKNLQFPSFSTDAVSKLPPEISEAQDAVLDATLELHDLFREPLSLLFYHGGVGACGAMTQICESES